MKHAASFIIVTLGLIASAGLILNIRTFSIPNGVQIVAELVEQTRNLSAELDSKFAHISDQLDRMRKESLLTNESKKTCAVKDGEEVEVVFYGNNLKVCPSLRSAIHTGFKHVTLLGWKEVEFAYLKKLTIFRDYLASHSEERTVLFLDGFDSIIFGSPQEVLENWRHALARQNSKNSVLVGLETNLWPDGSLRDRFSTHPPTPFFYPNSGVYMGRAEDVLQVLNLAIKLSQDTGEGDDQKLMQLVHLDNQGLITLDYYSELVTNMYQANVTLEQFDPHTLRPWTWGSSIFSPILHFNGDKSRLEYFRKMAWWDQKNSEEEKEQQIKKENMFILQLDSLKASFSELSCSA